MNTNKKMRIGLVSDTHMPYRARSLPRALVKGLAGVDHILHAGDWISPEVADMLERIAPVDGVAGNNDGTDIVNRYRYKKTVEWNGWRIGLTHGHDPRLPAEKKAQLVFEGEELDVIVFGHSHIPLIKQVGSTWLINPGSPTDKRREPQFSYAVLQLGDEISAQLYYYDSKD